MEILLYTETCAFHLYRYDQAQLLYDEMLEKEPTNTVIAKRKVAIHKAKGEIHDAIKELTKLLETYDILLNFLMIKHVVMITQSIYSYFLIRYMTDIESWGELADLYISQHR